MKDSEGSTQRKLRITPLWDPTGSVSVEVDEERRELVVTTRGEFVRFALRDQSPDRLGWVEHRLEGGRVRRRRVPVGEVVRHCLREWDTEQLVLELSRAAARRARARGGRWTPGARRLARQALEASRTRRISTLPFQVLFEYRAHLGDEEALSATLAAERGGYMTAAGTPDTQRLLRRSGLAPQHHGGSGGSSWQRSVRYETGVALCHAVGVDPVELGL